LLAATKAVLFAALISFVFMPAGSAQAEAGQHSAQCFNVFLNSRNVGMVDEKEQAEELLLRARRQIAAAGDELVLVESQLTYSSVELLPGEKTDDATFVLSNMVNVLRGDVRETLHRAYTVKINDFMVNLSNKDEVVAMLQAAIDKYDAEKKYAVELTMDLERELSVLTTNIYERSAQTQEQAAEEAPISAGIDEVVIDLFATARAIREKEFEDYDRGLIMIDFGDTVEVVEAYLAASELMALDTAIEEITKEEEKNQIYVVAAGDTLSGISLSTNIPMDVIIELNDTLDNEHSTIRVDEELIITVPEPEIVILREEESFITEYYNEDIIYIANDDWYTNQTKTLQEPSAGVRNIAAITSYRNDAVVSREILKEEVIYQGVAKIVERGTKIPPTYIKPLYGGRMASGFGPRRAPMPGASTYHRGVDWGCPIGTAILASSGGVVAKAGWGSGYGYVVYINHPDGRQTRYAHLSRPLVSVGQAVAQGERIALSGNTGISTGPHLHFEILINGVHVNPLRYLQ